MSSNKNGDTAKRVDRTQLRARRDGGYIGPLVLALMLMVSATSLVVFSQTSATIVASQNSRDFVLAEENVDRAFASAVAWLNDTSNSPASAPAGGSGGGEGGPSAKSEWSWGGQNLFTVAGALGGGQISATGKAGDTSEVSLRAWRQRYVGSVVPEVIKNPDGTQRATGKYVYGVAAPGAWMSAVSTQDNSTFEGRVSGDWALYGRRTLTIPSSSRLDRVISYNDSAGVDNQGGGAVSFIRSTLTATHDENLLNARVSACSRQLFNYRSSQAPPASLATIGGAPRCYYSVNIDSPTTFTGAASGVATVISYGAVRISSNVTLPAGTQLHIYTANGSVKFSGGGRPQIGGANGGVFIFAPNALCASYFDTSITLFGSLACRATEFIGDVTYERPQPEYNQIGTPGVATRTVRYLEAPDYRDYFGS